MLKGNSVFTLYDLFPLLTRKASVAFMAKKKKNYFWFTTNDQHKNAQEKKKSSAF